MPQIDHNTLNMAVALTALALAVSIVIVARLQGAPRGVLLVPAAGLPVAVALAARSYFGTEVGLAAAIISNYALLGAVLLVALGVTAFAPWPRLRQAQAGLALAWALAIAAVFAVDSLPLHRALLTAGFGAPVLVLCVVALQRTDPDYRGLPRRVLQAALAGLALIAVFNPVLTLAGVAARRIALAEVPVMLLLFVLMAMALLGMLAQGQQRRLRRALDLVERELRIDALTGSFNRRYFEETGRRLMLAFQRYGRPVCLVLVDIDHFKAINDRFGHIAGDHVLVGISRRLANAMREVDMVFRIGGDEFAILMPETELAPAVAAIERLCDRLRNEAAASGGHLPSCTFGVAAFAATDAGIDDVIRRADAAVYAAKAAGRARVAAAPDPAPAGTAAVLPA